MRRLAAVVLTLLATMGAAPAAHAAGELGLSYDGVHWTGSLSRPLFDPTVRWVPGDVRTARFFVRDQSDAAGDLTVDVERTRRDALIDTGWLEISARAAGRPWTSVDDGGLQRLLTQDDLASGRPVAVEVRVRMDRQAPNGTMVLATDLDFRVTLTESAAGPSGPGGTDGTSGQLPDTGTTVPVWLLPLALLLLGSGAVLAVRRRDPLPLTPHHPHQENP